MLKYLICLFRRVFLKQDHKWVLVGEEYNDFEEELTSIYDCDICGEKKYETRHVDSNEYKREHFYMRFPNYDY